MIPCCLFSAIILYLFRFVHDLPGLIVISIAYGFISGGMASLPPATIANLTSDPTQYGSRMGMAYTIAAFGALMGNPVAGAARHPSGSSTSDLQAEFQRSWIFAASFMLLATVFLALTQYLKTGFGKGQKV